MIRRIFSGEEYDQWKAQMNDYQALPELKAGLAQYRAWGIGTGIK